MALQKQKLSIPLSKGLNTKSDPRALQAPELAVCRDAEFDEIDGIQTRKPYVGMPTDIDGGGTIADPRKIVAMGNELILFTKDKLYSWSDANQVWVLKDTYLAPTVAEESMFVRTSEQTQCDRAELDGVVFYAWTDAATTTAVHLAAVDKATGAVMLAPTAVGSSSSRPRLVTMQASVYLFYLESTTLSYIELDPAAISVAGATIVTTNCNSYYDVAANATGTFCVVANRRAVTTSYAIHRIDGSGISATTPARTCDGPIAVSIPPSDTAIQIVRANGTNIQGDLLLKSDLTDIWTAQAIGTAAGTPVNQIAACHSTTAVGLDYRCHVFWSSLEEFEATAFDSKYNTVDTDDTIGTQARLAYRLGIASRAFDHAGSVFVWTAFAGTSNFSGGDLPGLRAQLQNTYFLYRDDGRLVAKAAMFRAGGHSAATGHLPHVQAVGDDTYAWCGVERRIVPIGVNHTGYSARAPRDIQLTFDSDEARRCVRLGETLYITGGEILQYDGVGLYEVGFHIFPWRFGAEEATSTGSVAAGTYNLKNTVRWDNAKGERDRSTTATSGSVEVTTGNTIRIPSWAPVQVTHKTSPAAVQEIWRTAADPTSEAPHYLTTSNDPTDTGANGFVLNDHDADFLASFDDELSDDDLTTRETNPENGGILENIAPPPATIIAANQDRIFLAGVACQPYTIHYSKLRGAGEVAAFHDGLTVDVPPEGGPITALALLDETLIAFCETAIYALPGEGYDNASGGQNYGPARRLSADCGAVSAEAVATTPAGLMFKSRKGWYMLPPAGSPQYIGADVAAFDDDEVLSIHVMDSQHQIRCMTDSRVLTFDYVGGQWSEWTINDGLGAVIWDGTYTYLDSTGAVQVEQTDYSTGVDYGLDVESAWIPTDQLMQGFGAIYNIMVLGEYRGACRLRVRIAYDYNESDAAGPTWVDDRVITQSPAVVGGPLQLLHGVRHKKAQAFKVRLTAVGTADLNPPSTEALRLTSMAIEVGFKSGLNKKLPALQRQ